MGTMELLLEILAEFTKNEKWFAKMHKSVIEMMIAYFDKNGSEKESTLKLKQAWAVISIYIFKSAAYHRLIENVYFAKHGINLLMEDENTMNRLIELMNNRNADKLAVAILEWNVNHPFNEN